MNEKEIGELRRRIRPDRSGISRVRGCYVNENKEIIAQVNQSLAMMTPEEADKFLTLLRKVLTGGQGRNLIDISFATQQVASGAEHQRLMRLRKSALQDEDAVEELFRACIEAIDLEGNYLILLAFDAYDVPYRAKDGKDMADAGGEVFSYVLCSVCPVKQTKPALSYVVEENAFRANGVDYLVSPPELGFLFPAFDDRSTNLYNALYYTRNAADSHPDFVSAVFRTPPPMAAETQRETFGTILGDALGEDCRFEVVQTVHDQLCGIIQEHKDSRDPEPLTISKQTVHQVLSGCGVSNDHIHSFAQQYDAAFGEDTDLSPKNLVNAKAIELKTPYVTVSIDPERTDLVKTRIIDGKKYILIHADEGVEVNGIPIHIDE